MKDTVIQPFTGLQFYLAHARNTVHAVLLVEEEVTDDIFADLVRSVLELAPQLQWEESTVDGCYRPAQTIEEIVQSCQVEYFTTQNDADTAFDKLLHAPLADRGLASFQACCQKIRGDDGQVRSRLVFHTTHGIMEGGDVANILRGRLTSRSERPIDDSDMQLLGRIMSSAVVPLMWVAHMTMAWAERRVPSDFGYVRFAIDRSALKMACTELGVDQRSLLFAIVSEAYRRQRRPNKPLLTLYSTLPAKRSRLIDDEYLNVRTDEVTFKPKDNLHDYITHVKEMVASRGKSPMFVATCQRKLLRIHMAVHRRFPRVYPRQFFGFAPQHLVLSMIPPVRTGHLSAALEDAVVLAGSNTGTATSCIFVPSARTIGLCFWTDIGADTLKTEIDDILTELGIGSAIRAV